MLMELIRNRLKNREYTKKRYLDAGLIPAPEETTFSLADETFLVKLNRIIQENLSDTKLDVSFICKEVGMSRASLYTKLKALTGIGLNEYINKIRMEKAILLITATDFTFTDISEKVGFTTISYSVQHLNNIPEKLRQPIGAGRKKGIECRYILKESA